MGSFYRNGQLPASLFSISPTRDGDVDNAADLGFFRCFRGFFFLNFARSCVEFESFGKTVNQGKNGDDSNTSPKRQRGASQTAALASEAPR